MKEYIHQSRQEGYPMPSVGKDSTGQSWYSESPQTLAEKQVDYRGRPILVVTKLTGRSGPSSQQMSGGNEPFLVVPGYVSQWQTEGTPDNPRSMVEPVPLEDHAGLEAVLKEMYPEAPISFWENI